MHALFFGPPKGCEEGRKVVIYYSLHIVFNFVFCLLILFPVCIAIHVFMRKCQMFHCRNFNTSDSIVFSEGIIYLIMQYLLSGGNMKSRDTMENVVVQVLTYEW